MGYRERKREKKKTGWKSNVIFDKKIEFSFLHNGPFLKKRICRLILKLENFIFFCFHHFFFFFSSSFPVFFHKLDSLRLSILSFRRKKEKKTKHLGPRFYLFGTMQRCRFIQELSGVFRGDARMKLKQGGQKVSLLYMSTNSEFITTKMHKDTSA